MTPVTEFWAAMRSGGGLSICSPPPPDVWLYLEPDAETPAVPADNESTADQMLSGSFEFLKLLAVPFGYLTVKKPDGLPVNQYCNARRHARISRN